MPQQTQTHTVKFCGLLFQWLRPSESLSLFMLHSTISCVQQSTQTHTHTHSSEPQRRRGLEWLECVAQTLAEHKKNFVHLFVRGETYISLYVYGIPMTDRLKFTLTEASSELNYIKIFTNLTLAMRNFSQSFRVHFTTVCVCSVFLLSCCESECDVWYKTRYLWCLPLKCFEQASTVADTFAMCAWEKHAVIRSFDTLASALHVHYD